MELLNIRAGGYIFVEAFFIITGYYTTKHFNEQKVSGFWGAICSSVKYTYRKFGSYLPYTFPVVMISLIVKHCLLINDYSCNMAIKAILESMMLICGDANVGVLWYLASMLPVFPFFLFWCAGNSQKIRNYYSIICNLFKCNAG